MNRIEFMNLIQNRPDTIEMIQKNFINYMAVYNLISSYNISSVNVDSCTFTITFDKTEDLQKIYEFLPNDMYMYDKILRFEKAIVQNSIIIKIF